MNKLIISVLFPVFSSRIAIIVILAKVNEILIGNIRKGNSHRHEMLY